MLGHDNKKFVLFVPFVDLYIIRIFVTIMKLSETNYNNAQTGCCALINPEEFDGKEFVWENKLFVKDHIRSFLHMPLNFGSVMGRMHAKVESAEAYPENGIMLSDETSLWGADAYLEVDREVPGCEMASMSGTFLAKVFEGPYSNMRQWIQEMEEYVGSQNKELKKMYFYYSACPKCAKTFGKNYVVIFAQVA